MPKKEVLGALIDPKISAILKAILNTGDELLLKEISEMSRVSMASTYRILKTLMAIDVIEKKVWKTSKAYRVKENTKVTFLKELFHYEYYGITDFIESMEAVDGISSIIMHGKQKRGKANILLIGKNIETDKVDIICDGIRAKGFDITYFPLTIKQYEQMSKMGLYAGEKKILK